MQKPCGKGIGDRKDLMVSYNVWHGDSVLSGTEIQKSKVTKKNGKIEYCSESSSGNPYLLVKCSQVDYLGKPRLWFHPLLGLSPALLYDYFAM